MWSLFCGLTGGKAGSAMTWSKGTCGMKGARGLCMKPPRPPRPNPRPPRPVRTMVPIDQIKFCSGDKSRTQNIKHSKRWESQNTDKSRKIIAKFYSDIITQPYSYSLPLSLVEIISRNKIFLHLSVALNWEILEHDGDFIPRHLQIIFCGVYTTAFQVFWRRLLRNLKQHHALETKSVHGTSVPSDRNGNSRW